MKYISSRKNDFVLDILTDQYCISPTTSTIHSHSALSSLDGFVIIPFKRTHPKQDSTNIYKWIMDFFEFYM